VPTAPQITSDLPLQVTLVSGDSYTYSIGVNATAPFSYQWYNGAAPLPGQTNASYTLTAGSPGTYTYQVVITNAYGATTSSASTMTVLPLPITAYAAAVRACQPVGYWPLQETSAPAPARVPAETVMPPVNVFTPEIVNKPELLCTTLSGEALPF